MNDTTFPSPDAGAPKTLSHMLGEIVWLMTQSPIHKQMFLADLEWFCMPAVILEQYRVFYGPNSPAAVVLWASVSDEVEQRLIAGGSRLKTEEWNSGANRWLIELVAPFGGQDEILRDVAATVFEGQPFKFHHVAPNGERVVGTCGPALEPAQ